MRIKFSKIASIELRHDYFYSTGLDWSSDWPKEYTKEFLPKIHPTKSTYKFLEDLGLRLVKDQRGISIYAEIREDAGVYFLEKEINKNIILEFEIEPPFPTWFNNTRSYNKESQFCLYSNKEGFKSGSEFYLHNEIATTSAGFKEPSELRRSGLKVFEALERTNTQPPGAKWRDLGSNKNYTTLSNTIDLKKSSVLFKDTTLAGKTISVNNVYDEEVFSKTIEVSSTINQLYVDLSFLPDGKYSSLIDGVKQENFYLGKNIRKNRFGIIRLFIQSNPSIIPAPHQINQEWLPIGNGTSSLAIGQVNPINFVIHFLPHIARWKYIVNKDLNINPADVTSAGYQKLSNTEFISNEAQTISYKNTGADLGLTNKFPAPGSTVLETLKNGSGETVSYVSEIFVNV